MALTIFEETFGKARVKRGDVRRVMKDDGMQEHLVSVLDAVQSVVDTQRDPNTGDRYIVSLDPDVGAATEPNTKRIVITWRPVFDKSIRVSTACTVMTGLVFHEIGHTLDTFPNLRRFEEVYGIKGAYEKASRENNWSRRKAHDALAWTVLNIADDARLEKRQTQRFPIARDVFPTMLHWVAMNTNMLGEFMQWDQALTSAGLTSRVNFVTFATRYPWCARWSKDPVTRAERKWWQEWRDGYAAIADGDVDSMLDAIAVALDRLRSPEREAIDEDEVDTEEDEQPTNPGEDFDEDNDEDEDADDDETDEDETEPGDEPGGDDDGGFDQTEDFTDEYPDEPKGEGKGNEGEPDPDAEPEGEGGDDGEDADDDETDDEGEGKGKGDGEDGDDGDDDADDDETDPDGEGKGEGKSSDIPPDGWDEDEGEGGDTPVQKKPVAPEEEFGDLIDFDSRNIRKGVDDLNHGEDYHDRQTGRMMAQVANKERAIDRVKTGLWGTAKVAPISANDWTKGL